MTLLRLLGKTGAVIRVEMSRKKNLRLEQREEIGRALSLDEESRLLSGAKAARSPFMYPVVSIGLNTGMRDTEIRTLRWEQLNFSQRILTVGKSKTRAGTGRTIPLNEELVLVLSQYAEWYRTRIGPTLPSNYLFPFGRAQHWDPTRPVTTLKTAWQNLKRTVQVECRFHDLRHTCGTKLAETDASDETIMSIMGHVSRRMLTHYSHIRTEHKRRALEVISTKRAEEKSRIARVR
ncbi:MAG TPA: site-specific integrase [Terriglobia bacterium]|nr:site-specific integrase [Terriglobia bacterium]